MSHRFTKEHLCKHFPFLQFNKLMKLFKLTYAISFAVQHTNTETNVHVN